MGVVKGGRRGCTGPTIVGRGGPDVEQAVALPTIVRVVAPKPRGNTTKREGRRGSTGFAGKPAPTRVFDGQFR